MPADNMARREGGDGDRAPGADPGQLDLETDGLGVAPGNLPVPVDAREESLPGIIDRARRKLAEARTSAEVLESSELFDRAFHIARIEGASVEVQKECLRLGSLAKARFAAEYDAAKERGEVARQGHQPANIRGADVSPPPTLEELGVEPRRLSEWRVLADAGEKVVQEAVEEAAREAELEKRPVSKKAVERKVREKSGKAAGPKKDGKPRGKPREESKERSAARRPPAEPERPEHLTRLALWLRAGADLERRFSGASEAVSLAAEHRVDLDAGEVRTIVDFLTGLREVVESSNPMAKPGDLSVQPHDAMLRNLLVFCAGYQHEHPRADNEEIAFALNMAAGLVRGGLLDRARKDAGLANGADS